MISRAIDNRAGAWVAAESVRLYGEQPGTWRLTGVAAISEETSFAGREDDLVRPRPRRRARDRRHPRDGPPERLQAEVPATSRSAAARALARGASVHPRMFELLVETADAEGIPYQVEPANGHTWTDADAIHLARAGVPTSSSACRCATCTPPTSWWTSDLAACAELVAAFARRLADVSDRRLTACGLRYGACAACSSSHWSPSGRCC